MWLEMPQSRSSQIHRKSRAQEKIDVCENHAQAFINVHFEEGPEISDKF